MIPATTSDGFLLGLESRMRSSGQKRHLSATVIELTGQPDAEALKSSATRLAKRHPLLNARIKRGRDFVAGWHPGESSPVPLQIHPPGQINTLIPNAFETSRVDIRKDGPNLEIHALPIDRQNWALILIWPHSLFDAIGIEKLVAELDDPSEKPRQDWGETSKTEGGVGELWAAAKPMIEEMRTFPAWRIRSLHRGKAPGAPRFEVLRFNAEETSAIRSKMAASAGELLTLPYLAVCAGRAVRSVISARHPEEDVPILLSLPVQRTANPAKRPLFQNHMVAYSILLEASELEELAAATKALYRKYSTFLRRKLHTAMDSLLKLMERCPSRFYLKPASFYLKGEICSLFHSHTGRFASGLSRLFGCEVTNGYHVPTVSTPPGIGIFFSEYGDRLTGTLSWREGNLNETELTLLKTTLLNDLGTA